MDQKENLVSESTQINHPPQIDSQQLPEKYITIPEYEVYFQKHKQGLVKELEISQKTIYGEKMKAAEIAGRVVTYDDFWQSVPILESEEMTDNPLDFVNNEHLSLDKMIKLLSGASTGKPKETYYDRNDARIELPEYIVSALNQADKTVLFHEKRDAVSHNVIDEAIARLAPKASRLTYEHASDFLKTINSEKPDALYLTTQVSAGRRFMYEIKSLLETNPYLFDEVDIPHFFLEVVAEPVDIHELQDWHTLLQKAFKNPPDITVVYALSEAFVMGTYRYQPGDQEIIYVIKDNRFVEIVDPTTDEPVKDVFGDIVVTPINKVSGSIYPRYRTGDRAKLMFNTKGQILISEVGRDPNKGTLNLRGYKIFAPNMMKVLGEKFTFPIQGTFQVVENGSSSKTNLNIELYSPQFTIKPTDAKSTKEFLQTYFQTEYSFLDEMIQDGLLTITISTSDAMPEDMIKGWRVKPKQIIEIN